MALFWTIIGLLGLFLVLAFAIDPIVSGVIMAVFVGPLVALVWTLVILWRHRRMM